MEGAGEDGSAETEPQWIRRAWVGGVFTLFLIVGLAAFNDFGVSWDEPDYYKYGRLTVDFYAHGDRAWETFSNFRYYGPVVPAFHHLVASAAGVTGPDVINLAHLVNYLIFLAGAWALYLLLRLQTGSWRWALLGPVLLVLSPRFFSHAFVNPKDTPFLALVTLNMCLLVHYLETKRRWFLVALGAGSAVLVDIRVTGLFVVFLAGLAFVVEAATEAPPRRLLAAVRPTAVVVGVMVPLAILGWPYLWAAPASRLQDAIEVMSNFVTGPQEMFFMGRVVPVPTPPRTYVPVWIAVTTPLPYLVLAAVGIVRKLGRGQRRLFEERSTERFYGLYAVWFFVPILLVIVQRSPLYDEWRHVNFVYPALIVFAVAGAQGIGERLRRLRTGRPWAGFRVLLGLSLAWVAVMMVRLHPYEAVYFNSLTGGTKGGAEQFEVDYWGLSYLEGLERLLDQEPGPLVLYGCTQPAELNARQLAAHDRIRWVDSPEDADFVICAPRARALDGPYLPDHPTVLTVERDGATLLYVKDMRRGA